MAPSIESNALAELFQTIGPKFPADGDPFVCRALYDQVHRAAAEAPGVSYENTVVADRPCLWARPENASQNHVILFMHGGGYTFGSPNGHRKLTGHLARACNCLAISVDYRLTPEHPYPAGLNDCVAVYKWLLEHGFAAEHVVMAGDSCGGALSTCVPLSAREQGLPVPGCVVSLSPGYDLAADEIPSRKENETNDVLNTTPLLHSLVAKYLAGGASRTDPLVSPMYADLTGLPPHWISCAGFDMLRDDGTLFGEKLRKAGVEVVVEVHEGQQHVFEFMAGKAPEADRSIQQIGQWVRQKVGS